MATQEVHHVALTLTDHLPILQVLVPFVAAPLVVVLGSRRLAWPIAFAASAIAFVIACLLLLEVLDGSPLLFFRHQMCEMHIPAAATSFPLPIRISVRPSAATETAGRTGGVDLMRHRPEGALTSP